jgi:hypothetical protein
MVSVTPYDRGYVSTLAQHSFCVKMRIYSCDKDNLGLTQVAQGNKDVGSLAFFTF